MDGLTQDGLAYCGLGRVGASNADWPGQGFEALGDAASAGLRVDSRRSPLDCEKSLARTIETEIIPRLMLLHRSDAADRVGTERASEKDAPDLDETLHFCDLVMNHSLAAGVLLVEKLIAEGITLERIYLNLFAPAARRMGEMWETDVCSFADVTIGLGRLQQIMHSLSSRFRGDGNPWASERRALLIPAPGEQHTFGLFMVSEFFRRSGWNVWGEPPSSTEALTGIVGKGWFDIIGISGGGDTRVEPLARLVKDLRRASLNREVPILVGGPIFLASPELVECVGADAMAVDAKEALVVAESCLKRQKTVP